MRESTSRVFQLTLTPTEKRFLRELAQAGGETMRALLRRLIREAASKAESQQPREGEAE